MYLQGFPLGFACEQHQTKHYKYTHTLNNNPTYAFLLLEKEICIKCNKMFLFVLFLLQLQKATAEKDEWKEKYDNLNQSNPAEKRHLYKLDKLKFENDKVRALF